MRKFRIQEIIKNSHGEAERYFVMGGAEGLGFGTTSPAPETALLFQNEAAAMAWVEADYLRDEQFRNRLMQVVHVHDMDAATLRAWRSERGLSGRAAAEFLGVSTRTLEGLEQGRSPTSPLWGPIARIIELTCEPATAE